MNCRAIKMQPISVMYLLACCVWWGWIMYRSICYLFGHIIQLENLPLIGWSLAGRSSNQKPGFLEHDPILNVEMAYCRRAYGGYYFRFSMYFLLHIALKMNKQFKNLVLIQKCNLGKMAFEILIFEYINRVRHTSKFYTLFLQFNALYMYCDVVALKFELNLAGIMGKRDGRGETYSTTKYTMG